MVRGLFPADFYRLQRDGPPFHAKVSAIVPPESHPHRLCNALSSAQLPYRTVETNSGLRIGRLLKNQTDMVDFQVAGSISQSGSLWHD